MVDVKKDKYVLGESDKQTLDSLGGEIRLDLNLSLEGRECIGGTVKGTVKDLFSVPIGGALVKLMSMTHEPIMHTITSLDGKYILNNIPINQSFKIYAIASGKKLKNGTIVASRLAQKLQMDFTLENDLSKRLAIIAGDVFDINSKEAITSGVIIKLYSTGLGGKNLVASTEGNKYGQFTFRDIALGSYDVLVTASGYSSSTISINPTTQGEIVPVKVELTEHSSDSGGTLSGVIKDDTDNPVAFADVILYKVESDNSLTPVAFTKTNPNGVYLFANLPQAAYKIKSTESTTITALSPNSPNYYGFAIANVSSLNPIVIRVEEDATLSNGANYVLDNSFVSSLGSVTGGVMDINITAPAAGYYDVSINYLSGNSDTTIIMQVDPDNNGTQATINFPKTNSWNLTDAKTVKFTLALNSGINQYLLFNTDKTPTPWIGDFSIQYFEQPYEANSSDAVVEKGAIYLAPFITNLGGPINGSATFTVDVPFTQPYKLGITYLAGDEDRPLKLDIDDVNQANIRVPKTNDWLLSNAKVYELEIEVEEGERKFKFYNDTGEYAANVGNLRFDEYTIYKTFEPKDVNLLEGANLVTDINGIQYITGINRGNGIIQLVVVVFETQLYDFEIQYHCLDDRVCNVSVNDELVEYQDFKFKATGNAVGTFYARLFLTKGNNIISIFNE